MYLSRLILEPRCRAVQRDLADCQALHRTIMSLFGGIQTEEARARLGILHRLETSPRAGQVTLLLQSAEPPDLSGLPPGYLAEGRNEESAACKELEVAYATLGLGRRLRFRLLANPTKKVDTRSGPAGERRNGRRVPLRGEEAQLAWLARKGEEGGFRLLTVNASPAREDVQTIPSAQALPAADLKGKRPGVEGGKATLTFAPVLFEGVLQVADPTLFRQALARGIGPGKAYGFGLVSLAPA